jgi:hypothetical protein
METTFFEITGTAFGTGSRTGFNLMNIKKITIYTTLKIK